MNQNTLILTANGVVNYLALGGYNFMVVRSLKGTCEVSFDGQNWQPAAQNDSFGPITPQPDKIYFRATNGQAATVTFVTGLEKMSLQATATSVSSSEIWGNCGIAAGAAAAGGNPACDASGRLLITNGMAYKVPGTRNGVRRLSITFDVVIGSPVALAIKDSTGKTFMSIQPGNSRQLVMDADVWLSGVGGTAWVTVGQIYLEA